MFRSEKQQCNAIQKLLRPLHLDYLWTESGPTPQACKYLKGNPLSSGEDILLRAAFDLWNGAGKVTLWDLQGKLDQKHAEHLLSLVIAIGRGSDAVDQWLNAPVPRDPFEDRINQLVAAAHP